MTGKWWLAFLVLAVAFFAVLALLIVHYDRRTDSFAARCRAAHGVPFQPRGGAICLRSRDVIPMGGSHDWAGD